MHHVCCVEGISQPAQQRSVAQRNNTHQPLDIQTIRVQFMVGFFFTIEFVEGKKNMECPQT